jgi:hypothetical protein
MTLAIKPFCIIGEEARVAYPITGRKARYYYSSIKEPYN